jgi:hypothetical protein
MSEIKTALTNYYNFAVDKKSNESCAFCGKPMRWAKTQCSNCKRFFCASHMDPFIGANKRCPDCVQAVQSLRQDAVPTAFQVANSHYENNNIREAQRLENKLFATIFGNQDLIKFAQENDQNIPDNSTSTMDSVPTEEVPQEVEAPKAPETPEEPAAKEEQTENIAVSEINNLVAQQANEFLQEITSLNSALTPEQIEELFKNKIINLINRVES